LRVVVLSSHGIAPAPPAGAPGAGGGAPGARPTGAAPPEAEGLAAYCQLQYGRQLLRTPMVHHTREPAWDWGFSLALPAAAGALAPADDAIALTLFDAKTLGEPAALGRATVGAGWVEAVAGRGALGNLPAARGRRAAGAKPQRQRVLPPSGRTRLAATDT
jgi:hypothetical protein